MKLNFKNLKKNALNIGLTAILTSSSLAVNQAESASVSSMNSDNMEMSVNELNARWAVQEKSLTSEQKNLWKQVTKDKRFKNILPRILEQLDIARIQKPRSGNIVVPFFGKKDVALSWDPKLGEYELMVTKESMADNIIPAHEMSPFMTDKLDCFFIPQPEDADLSEAEKEFIKTLDNCLNKMYAFVYARGTANIDKKALMNGDYAGKVWDSHCTVAPSRGWERLNPQERAEFKKMEKKRLVTKNFPYQNVADIRADYPTYTKEFSDNENEIYMSLGYPFTVKDLAEKGAKFIINGGCAGEMLISASPAGAVQGVPWLTKTTDKMASQTLYQYKIRKQYDIWAFCNGKEEGFKEGIFPKYNIDTKNLRNLTPLQKAIVKRYETVKQYNKKIVTFIERAKIIPLSLAHEKLLTHELTENYSKMNDGKKVGTHDTISKLTEQKKNWNGQNERAN